MYPPPPNLRALRAALSVAALLLIALANALLVNESQAQTAPSAPRSLSATGACTAGQVELSWSAPATGTASKYQTRQKAASASWPSNGGWSDTTPATATASTVTTSTDGSSWDIQVRAVDTSASTPANGTAASTTATAFRVSCPIADESWPGPNIGSLRTSWATPNTAGLRRTRFEYRFKQQTAGNYPTSGTGSWATVTGGPNIKQVIISSLSARNWNVQIRAVADDSGTDVYSKVETSQGARAYLNPVTNLTATTGTQPGTVNLTWTNPTTGNGQKIARWKTSDQVTYRRSAGADLINGAIYRAQFYLGSQSASQTSITITVEPATEYEFAIGNSAFTGSSGLATATATSQAVPIPANPAITGSTTNYGQATVSWEYPQPAAIVLDGFQYQTRSEGEITWPATWTTATAPAVDPNVPGTTWSADITGTPGDAIEARIRAIDSFSRSARSGTVTYYSNPIEVTGNLALPAQPQSVTAQPGENVGDIIITWSVPTGEPIAPAAIAGFRIRTKPQTSDSYSDWTVLPPTATSYTAQTMAGRTPHDVQLQLIIDTDGDLVTTTNDLIYSTSATTTGTPNAPTGPLPKPQGLRATTTTDTATLTWNEPSNAEVTGFRYRHRRTDDADTSQSWTQWTTVAVVNTDDDDKNEPQTALIRGLASETSYTFQLQATSADRTSESANITATTSIALPRINSIKPTIRTVTMQANTSIRLAVNVYGRQDDLTNTAADNQTFPFEGITTTYLWSERSGGGTFAAPNNTRSVLYTAPNSPGTFTINAEVQPHGICIGHLNPDAVPNPCIATFTIQVTRATDAAPTPVPRNPDGLIPTSLTDSEGNAYAVLTPAEGGTFTAPDNNGIKISAPPGAVPDNTIIAIRAHAAEPTVTASATRFTLANNRARISAIDANGNTLQDYQLNQPLQVCLPLPDQFRDRLDAVTIVKLPDDIAGHVATLTSKTYNTPEDGLRLCAALSTLPATIAPARFGIQPTATPESAPKIGDIETGGQAPPTTWLAVAILLAGTLIALVVPIGVGIIAADANLRRAQRKLSKRNKTH